MQQPGNKWKMVPDFIKQIVHFSNKPLVLLFKLQERGKKKVLLEFTSLDSVNFPQPSALAKQPSPSFTKISKDDYH